MTTPDSLALLTAARGYIARGWHVFVLGRTKRPVANCEPCAHAGPDHDREACPCLTCHGFYAATLDPDRIAAMLTAVPDGLLAIRTGAVSGLTIVDIDPRNGGQLDRALMNPTATVATPGGGWHLYYQHPGRALPGKLPGRPGIDIKTDGGLVVAPPSTPAGAPRGYRWTSPARPVEEMAPRLLRLCQVRTGAPDPAGTGTAKTSSATAVGAGAGAISYPDALLAATLAAVDQAPQGRRRVTLYGAARGLARMVTADALTASAAVDALTTTGERNGQSTRDIRGAIKGGFEAEGLTSPL
ncbi:DNA primase [Parafrankia colletiae]|uniref:DNA primase n=1 Tax=Parafrankia colletiae TaxID=573497 RepID=A0A1S1RJ94_9ACTN|nr:bifunctional DNA primase/polymerase [Parafrankia colletiae]MCK9904353.1 bifunctional DNA primase/polymerase [Frankia sp. Cpl3]OHV46206.1 DNA primase [Parafrankia colletiae]